MNDTTLCVLAGGESRRFGSPKTDVTVDGHPICAWLLNRLRAVAAHAVLSTGQNVPPIPGAELFDQVIADQESHAGPLAGMLSVLNSLSCDDKIHHVVFVTIDMPLVSASRVEQLVQSLRNKEGLAGVMNRLPSEVPSSAPDTHRGTGVEPFPSAWRLDRAGDLFKQALEAGIRGPHRLAEYENVETLTICASNRAAFVNINTPADLAALAMDQPAIRLASPVTGSPQAHDERQ